MNTYKKINYIKNGIISAEKKNINIHCAMHQHDYFEIEYILKGAGSYVINGKVYPIKPSMLFFMLPSDFHEFNPTEAEIINIMFPIECIDLSSLSGAINISRANQLCETDDTMIKLMLFEVIDSVSKQNYPYALQFLSCIISKILSLSTSEKREIPSHICLAIIYMLSNFQNSITLSQTAKHIGISSAYLSNIFHDIMGITFKEYLDDVRFDYVIRLLVFTKMTISEICYDAGFKDYANFSRRFKDRYKMSPSEYRQKTLQKS